MLIRIWQVFTSTLAAFFGVQSEQNRVRDFNDQSPLPYIIMGIVMAVLLVLTLLATVLWVLS